MDLGLHKTHDDSTSKLDPEVLSIAKRITRTQSPEFGRVWDLFQAKDAPFQTDEFEIYVRNYTQPNIEVTASAGSADWDTDSATTDLPVGSDYVNRITIGDVIKVEDEIVVVKAVDRSANTIDVYERGAGESTAAAHGTDAITADVIGNAHEEGKVEAESMAEDTSLFTNYLQLVEEKVDLSKADSDQARKTGRTEDTLKTEAMERVFQDLARTAIHGVSREPSDTMPGMTRGLEQWLQLSGGLTTNIGGAFTKNALDGAIKNIRAKGGAPTGIVMSVNNKYEFNSFTSADQVNQDVNERTAGRIIERYLADGVGSLPVIVDIDMPDDKVAIVDSRKMKKGWKVNDELKFVEEPSNSRQKLQTLQGKFGLAVENVGQSHALLTGLTTS